MTAATTRRKRARGDGDDGGDARDEDDDAMKTTTKPKKKPTTTKRSTTKAPTTTTDHQLSDLVGVSGFMAPEVYRKQPYGYPVDAFAFGAVLRRMLSAVVAAPPRRVSGRRMRAWSLSQTLSFGRLPAWAYERVHCEPPVSRLWPEELSDLASRCCAVDPGARPTMAEAAEVTLHSGSPSALARSATSPA